MGKRKIVPNEVKRKVRAFVKSERGQVSKQNIITLSAFLGSAAVAGILAAKTLKAQSVAVSLDTSGGGTVTAIRGSYSP